MESEIGQRGTQADKASPEHERETIGGAQQIPEHEGLTEHEDENENQVLRAGEWGNPEKHGRTQGKGSREQDRNREDDGVGLGSARRHPAASGQGEDATG